SAARNRIAFARRAVSTLGRVLMDAPGVPGPRAGSGEAAGGWQGWENRPGSVPARGPLHAVAQGREFCRIATAGGSESTYRNLRPRRLECEVRRATARASPAQEPAAVDGGTIEMTVLSSRKLEHEAARLAKRLRHQVGQAI